MAKFELLPRPDFVPPHDECKDCKFFRPRVGNVRCLDCGGGEFFEEKIDDHAPDDDELMILFSHMSDSNDE
jgi:hypothetical protein